LTTNVAGCCGALKDWARDGELKDMSRQTVLVLRVVSSSLKGSYHLSVAV